MIATDVKQIACGNRKVHGFTPGFQHHHSSAAEVRQCFASETGVASLEEEEQYAMEGEYDPDAAYERHLENAGWAESAAQEDYEARMGMVSYEEARDAAVLAAHANADGSIVIPDEDGQPPLVIGPKEPVYDGIYTVEVGEEHYTFRLRTQKADDDFMPGRQIVAFLSGKDNEHDYTGMGTVTATGTAKVWKRYQGEAHAERRAALQRLLDNPADALQAAHCFRCHRTLTVPASVHAGLGPECAKKAGL